MAFLCYMKEDLEAVSSIFDQLQAVGVRPWMDKKSMPQGALWDHEIPKAINAADVFVPFLRSDFNNEGYRQKEVRRALEALQRRPPDRGFVVPFLLEPCDLPVWCGHFNVRDLTRPTTFDELLDGISALTGWSRPPGDVVSILREHVEIEHVRAHDRLGLTEEGAVVAKALCKQSDHGRADVHDPTLDFQEMLALPGLKHDDVLAAVAELDDHNLVVVHKNANAPRGQEGIESVSPRPDLFWNCDSVFMDWNPRDDAVELAKLAINQESGSLTMADASRRLSWEPRRINPAADFIHEHGYAITRTPCGPGLFNVVSLTANSKTRLFVKRGH